MLHFTKGGGGAFSSVVDLSLPNTSNKQYEGEWVYLQEKQLSLLIFISLFIRGQLLTLLHSEWPKLHRVLAVLGARGLKEII